MTEWYEKLSGDFKDRDAEYMLLAYRNTLCKTDQGKQVLCHLKTMLESIEGTDTEKLTARRLLDAIMNNCGITGNMKIVEALSGVADKFHAPEAREINLLT